jgi:hypothetical protein
VRRVLSEDVVGDCEEVVVALAGRLVSVRHSRGAALQANSRDPAPRHRCGTAPTSSAWSDVRRLNSSLAVIALPNKPYRKSQLPLLCPSRVQSRPQPY